MEKKDSIKTLLLTLWKTEDDKITKTESGELGSAVNAYIERIRADRNIVPCFDSFYEYLRDDYRRELEERGDPGQPRGFQHRQHAHHPAAVL